MSSGSVLDDCYEVRTCICCLPLRIGCIYIALAGIIMAAWGVLCILLTTFFNISHLKSVGLNEDLGQVAIFIFSVLNFLLFLASISLLVGACKKSNILVTIYVWYLAVYLTMMVLVTILVFIACALLDQRQAMVMFLLTGILIMIVFSHFFLVANSYRMKLL